MSTSDSIISSRDGLLVVYWVGCLVMGFTALYAFRSSQNVVLVRKFFHFLSVILFLPPISIDWSLDLFAVLSICVVTVMVIAECVRVTRPGCKFSLLLTRLFQPFLDKKDRGSGFITSHIELLIACTAPVVISQLIFPSRSFFREKNILLSGLITVGIGDSFAAIAGLATSRPLRVWRTTKTYQGMAGFVGSVLVCNWISGNGFHVIPTMAAAITEVVVKNHDNLAIPLAFILTTYLVA